LLDVSRGAAVDIAGSHSRPDQSPSRFVINFRDWPLEQAEQYPDCIRIVREKVKPERDRNTFSRSARDRWWLYERARPELYAIIAGMLEYVFVVDHTRGTQLLVTTLMLLLFSVNIPLLMAFTVARYQVARRK